MASYIYRRVTESERCEFPSDQSGEFVIVRPDGTLADWPLCDTESEAIAECLAFNSLDDDMISRNEAIWQARMQGDMEI